MQNILNNTLLVGTAALEIADIGGTPFTGSAAVLLSELHRSCEQVKIHKSHCRRLIQHAQTILDGLRSGTSGLEGAQLQQAADELEMILVQIDRRMSKWSEYNSLSSWFKRDDIFKSIQHAEQQLGAHVAKFNIITQVSTYVEAREAESLRRRDQEETREALDKILTNSEHLLKLMEMRSAGEHGVRQVMEAAQNELHNLPKDTPRYLQYERNVSNLYNTIGVMPTLPDLSKEVTKELGDPVAGGTYSDVWLGTWLGRVRVALKSLREVKVTRGALKRFEHEITVWHTLEHPNVLRFLGVVSNLGPHIHVVSPWQSNGNALDYVKSHLDVNRLKLLAGAAHGVEYLHSRDFPVVHGNLKCANVLVSDKGEALISDFGLSRVVGEITETSVSVTLTTTGNSRWCAPEIMSGITSLPTLASDVYSFAMAIVECLTLEKPFSHLKREPTVVIEVVAKKRPLRPTGRKWEEWFTEDLWTLMLDCWNHEPSRRPLMKDVAVKLTLHAESWDAMEHTDT